MCYVWVQTGIKRSGQDVGDSGSLDVMMEFTTCSQISVLPPSSLLLLLKDFE